MLGRGKYWIVQILDISVSLGSQIEEYPGDGKGRVHKCLAEMGSKQFILYFIDGVDFGQGSVIELLVDLKTPLIYKSEYRVMTKTPLVHEVEFIKRLRSQDAKGA